MKTENLTSINEIFLNEGLVIFDKKMEVFLSNETPKTSERKLQLVWDKI